MAANAVRTVVGLIPLSCPRVRDDGRYVSSVTARAPGREGGRDALQTNRRIGRRASRSRGVVCHAGNEADEGRGGPDSDGDDDEGKNHTVLVCGNKTCRRQGALNTIQFFNEVVSDKVIVKRVGCLGRCGSGPNVCLLPNELYVGHVNTAAHVARLVERQVVGGKGAETIVRTLALKMEGNELMAMGDAVEAEAAYTAAIVLNPERGAHILFSNRSAARLAQGKRRYLDALDDALETQRLAPQWFRAYSRICDAQLALGRRDEALAAMEKALELQPSLMGDTIFMSTFKDLKSSRRERSIPTGEIAKPKRAVER